MSIINKNHHDEAIHTTSLVCSSVKLFNSATPPLFGNADMLFSFRMVGWCYLGAVRLYFINRVFIFLLRIHVNTRSVAKIQKANCKTKNL